MPRSVLHEDLLHRHRRKSELGMHRLRTDSRANRPLRSGGGPSSRCGTPRSTASALPNTNGKPPAGREASADVPGGATSAVEGATAEKPKRKPKEKGWKGWAMVYYDDEGIVIEERLRGETPTDERPSIPPPARGEAVQRFVSSPRLSFLIGRVGARNGLTGVDVETTAAMSDVVPENRPRTSASSQSDQPTLPRTSTRLPSSPSSRLHLTPITPN
jgi:hypothetical protein